MDARASAFEIALPQRGTAAVDWTLHASDVRMVLEQAGLDGSGGPVCVLGSRLTDAARDRLTRQDGIALVDDPSRAWAIVVADHPAAIERTIRVLAGELPPDIPVACVDWAVPGWPGQPLGERAWLYHPGDRSTWGRFVEPHLLAIVHPEIDGFLVARLTAHVPIPDVGIEVTGEIAPFLTPHLLGGDLAPGQCRQADLEIHPGLIPRKGVAGSIVATSGGEPLGVVERITMAPSRRVQCVLSGHDEGPIAGERLERTVAALLAGRQPAWLVASRIWLADRRPGRGG